MLEHITPQLIAAAVGFFVAVLGGNAWITSALIDRKLIALNGMYVRSAECVLRSGMNREMISMERTESRQVGDDAVSRDKLMQQRIDDLMKIIAARTAEAILRDQEILSKINELLQR